MKIANRKNYSLKKCLYDLKMCFSFKNITFMHENLSHLFKCSLCVHNPSKYLLRKHLNRRKTVFYVNVLIKLSPYSGGQRVLYIKKQTISWQAFYYDKEQSALVNFAARKIAPPYCIVAWCNFKEIFSMTKIGHHLHARKSKSLYQMNLMCS